MSMPRAKRIASGMRPPRPRRRRQPRRSERDFDRSALKRAASAALLLRSGLYQQAPLILSAAIIKWIKHTAPRMLACLLLTTTDGTRARNSDSAQLAARSAASRVLAQNVDVGQVPVLPMHAQDIPQHGPAQAGIGGIEKLVGEGFPDSVAVSPDPQMLAELEGGRRVALLQRVSRLGDHIGKLIKVQFPRQCVEIAGKRAVKRSRCNNSHPLGRRCDDVAPGAFPCGIRTIVLGVVSARFVAIAGGVLADTGT